MQKYFDINDSGHSIRCKLFCEDIRSIRTMVLFCHGFGGHKDNRAAERFALKALGKHKGAAVLAFDWPCHGTDVKKKLTLADCFTYLELVQTYVRERMGVEDICVYATSFGGFLVLRYIADHGNPFRKIALRCPAIPMYDSMLSSVMTEENRKAMERKKSVPVGFDRKVEVSLQFLEDLKAADITQVDFLDYAEDILILHGTKDEIIPYAVSYAFADNNLIEFIPVENADHRFSDPKTMDAAIGHILRFFSLA